MVTSPSQIRRAFKRTVERLRLDLAGREALLPLSFLGVAGGLVAGGLIVLFRQFIESTQSSFMPGGGTENFESLAPVWRFLLPVIGAVLLGAIFHWLRKHRRRIGVVHVIQRLAYHQGYLSWKNALVEFVGAGISVITGQSVGREGPGVHLGAASTSQLGQRLGLPNNTLRVLVACGTAAAIGASFNTPLAGVIFAMEVVLMEYTMLGFAPVILAAVSGTAVMRMVYGDAPAFELPPISMTSLYELPYLVLLGLVIGLLAAFFSRMAVRIAHWSRPVPVWPRFALAGLLTGLLALPFPAIMGIGYDTVTGAVAGDIALSALVGIALAKIVATAAVTGTGLPGGFIGPTLVIGATAGGAMGVLGNTLAPTEASPAAFYALIGMGTMMAATLQAPLAALIAMLELTVNPNIILPGMLALIAGVLTMRELCGQKSIILQMMRTEGLDYRNDPVSQWLRRQGVASAMERSIVPVPRRLSREQARETVGRADHWLLIEADQERRYVLPGSDLARFVEGATEEEAGVAEDGAAIDLVRIPGKRMEAIPIHLRATLQEAFDRLRREDADAVWVFRPVAPGRNRVVGLLTREMIERSYSPGG